MRSASQKPGWLGSESTACNGSGLPGIRAEREPQGFTVPSAVAKRMFITKTRSSAGAMPGAADRWERVISC